MLFLFIKSVTIYMVFTKVPEANLAGVAPKPDNQSSLGFANLF